MKINVLTYGTHNPHCEAAAVVFAEFVADLQVIIYQNSPEHKNFSNHFEPSIFFLLDLRTFNMADRGSYACIYGGEISGDIIIIITNKVNIEPLEDGHWTGRYLQSVRTIIIYFL